MSRRTLLYIAAIPVLALGWWLGSPLFLDRTVDEALPDVAGVEVLARGAFADQDAVHKGTGSATLLRFPDGRQVLRFEDFEVTNGPDLKVIVSEGRAFTDHDELDEAGWVELEALKGNIGAQNYELPADLDVDALGSVVIWCKTFRVIFSVADFERV